MPGWGHRGRPSWVPWARRATLAAVAALSACAPPDVPPRVAHPLSPDLLELVRPDTVRSARVGGGAWYRYLWSPAGPWAIHLVEVEMERCEMGLRTLRAAAREVGGRGRETVSSMVARAGPSVLAAVNADFFTQEGATVGSEVVGGRVTAARTRPAVGWRPGDGAWLGGTTISGDTLLAGWPIAFRGGDGATEMVGGYPELLDRGARVGDLGVGERPAFAASRHPRTAVGYDPERRRLWLVVVDGRQPPHSAGMTLPELAALFEALGASEAVNLDGGGSSSLVVGGRVRNRPSDAQGERAVANALALVRDPRFCAPR